MYLEIRKQKTSDKGPQMKRVLLEIRGITQISQAEVRGKVQKI